MDNSRILEIKQAAMRSRFLRRYELAYARRGTEPVMHLREARNGAGRPVRPDFTERFWSRVRIGRDDECWPWTSRLNSMGYGEMKTKQWIDSTGKRIERWVIASRMAYYLVRGDIPVGLEPDHLCDNPPCCNPKHLELVTKSINLQRIHIRKYEGGNCTFLPGTATVCTFLPPEDEIIGVLTA